MYLLLRQVRDGEQDELKNYSQEQQAYNAALLINDGYVEGDTIKGGDTGTYIAAAMEDLTSAGHDLLERWEAEMNEPPTSPSQHVVETSIAVFISHSAKDADLAEALVELLRAAIGLTENEIRCTSVDGYRFPAGAETDEQLRKEVRSSKAFIGLITPNSIASAYVLFELGARWGANLHLAPLLAKGADATFLRGPLRGLNALDATSEAQLHQLLGEIAQQAPHLLNNPSVYAKALKRAAAAAATINKEESTASPPKEADILEPIVEKVLKMFFDSRDTVSAQEVATALHVSENEAKYYIDQLSDREFVFFAGNWDGDDSPNFRIQPLGRAYVMKHRNG
jgi:hypothetical protein